MVVVGRVNVRNLCFRMLVSIHCTSRNLTQTLCPCQMLVSCMWNVLTCECEYVCWFSSLFHTNAWWGCKEVLCQWSTFIYQVIFSLLFLFKTASLGDLHKSESMASCLLGGTSLLPQWMRQPKSCLRPPRCLLTLFDPRKLQQWPAFVSGLSYSFSL